MYGILGVLPEILIYPEKVFFISLFYHFHTLEIEFSTLSFYPKTAGFSIIFLMICWQLLAIKAK